MNNWYALVYNATVEFDKSLQAEAENLKEAEYTEEIPDGAFRIVNSIWANEDSNCKFKKEYINKVSEDYSANAESVPAGKLTDAVNSWVDKSTNGQISKISDDLSQVDLILANALYLRSGWLESFEKANTEEGDFKTINGDTVTKEYMSQVEKFGYYEDELGKLVVLPMKYGVKAAFIIGKISDIDKALSEINYVDVDVKLPKMDMESEFGSDELIGFLKERGAALPFKSDGTADFSLMSDSSVFIDEIIQKTRIKTDEEGLEASAVTAIMMTESAALVTEEPEVKEFHAEEPFQFMIYTPLENGENEILFYGHMVE
jgi:serpin B